MTGYTGSGCSTARQLLENYNQEEKLSLPDYEDLKLISFINKHKYDKLKRVWSNFSWSSFKFIEVSRVIFAFALHRALFESNCAQTCFISQIKHSGEAYREDLEGLKLLMHDNAFDEGQAKHLIRAIEAIPQIYENFRNKYSRPEFTMLLQDLGNNIRKYGNVSPLCNDCVDPTFMEVLPKSIKNIIKAYRNQGYTRFCIDAFRNPYEVEYFSRRYSEFYLVHIIRNSKNTKNALSDFSEKELKNLEERERGQRNKKTPNNINEWLTSQNVEECTQKADYFINNVQGYKRNLRYHLIRLLTLAHQPGCVPPTGDERSMQIAMTARHMSGCISRQVGAVVVAPPGFVVGVGWNDPPKGQVPCSLRTGADLVHNPTPEVFSDYEQSETFIGHMKNKNCHNHAFCFKDEYAALKNENKKVQYTRSLHAEENAFLQATDHSGGTLRESTLYSTTIPCMLCAKKVYHLGVKRIVYIDAYPDIAIEQVIDAGTNRPDVSPFEGATGSAYFRLFSPIVPEKDMIVLSQPAQKALPAT